MAPTRSNSLPSSCANKLDYGIDIKAPSDEVVAIRLGQNRGDPSVITINCPDQQGLGCDLARIIFEFELVVVRLDLSTDGRWLFVIFWVMPHAASSRPTRWAILKKRLVAACPSNRAPIVLTFMSRPKPKDAYILQVCASDRTGLLNDISLALWESELIIHKLKVTTTPAGKALGLLYITDTRDMLQTKRREEDVCNRLRTVIGDSNCSCELRVAGDEWGGLECAPASSLPHSMHDLFCESASELKHDFGATHGYNPISQTASVVTDNSLSPGHTLLQISCKARRGLLYDIMRSVKDFDIQIAYGRLSTKPKGTIEIDLFILQADGKKIVDPAKQKAFCTHLEMEILHPLRILIVNRGPDTELLIAAPIDVNGRGRPKVLFDTSLVLRTLDICIFKADMGRYTNADEKKWEVYRFLLTELSSSLTWNHIGERVSSALLG